MPPPTEAQASERRIVMKPTWTSLLVIAALGLSHAGCALFGGGGTDPNNTETEQNEPQNNGGGMDVHQFVKAPAKLALGPDAAQGQTLTRSFDSSGQTGELFLSIVADAGETWHVEAQNEGLVMMAAAMPDLQGLIIGMVVQKSDGSVTSAVLGKPGEAGAPIEILAPLPDSAGVDEDVTIGLGTFPATKVANDAQTMWTGKGGELDGVLLKLEPTGGDAYELSEMPSNESVDVGGTAVKARKYTYSDGREVWTTEQAIVAALNGGLLKMTSENYSVEVTRIGTDATARLHWN